MPDAAAAAAGPAGPPDAISGMQVAVPSVASSSGATPATGPATGTTATPAAIAAQVARQVTGLRTLTTGTQHTVLHLTPEHLGALTLTIDVRAGQVSLGIAGGQAALSTLREGLGQLRDQLAQAGLGLGDVSLNQTSASPSDAGAGNGNASARPDQAGQPGEPGQPRGQFRGEAAQPDTTPRADTARPVVVSTPTPLAAPASLPGAPSVLDRFDLRV